MQIFAWNSHTGLSAHFLFIFFPPHTQIENLNGKTLVFGIPDPPEDDRTLNFRLLPSSSSSSSSSLSGRGGDISGRRRRRVLIVRENEFATNGVLHQIDGLLPE